MMFNLWPFNKIALLTRERDDALEREKELSKKLRKAELQIDELKCRNNQLAAALRGDPSWQTEKRFMSAKVPSKTPEVRPIPRPHPKHTSTTGVSSQTNRDGMLTGIVVGAAVAASVMDSSQNEPCGTTDTGSSDSVNNDI